MNQKVNFEEAHAAFQPIYERMSKEAIQGMLLEFMGWRGLQKWDVVCTSCNGTGNIHYGCGSTWRGGPGGAAITLDVCDKCWGSGSSSAPGTDLRKLENELKELRKFKKAHEKQIP